ncbi:LysR family transcriptional regulator [Variovorax sp. 22077]|uniref:LysR family transcriptional regulator n=1 Tax=Variovorax sp. 22077 TaxID=3453867 RepID=UPI003F84F655
MELRQLRYFLAVAEHGSVAAASRVLHIAQPALSRQIASIEDQMGSRLFDRLPRGVALTRAGRELVGRAARVLQDANELQQHVAQAATGSVGTLRVGVMPGHSALPALGSAIQVFTQDSPEVTIALETQLSNNQMAAIKEGKLDAGLVVWRSLLDPTLAGELIHRDEMVVAMPRAVSLAKGRVRRLSQLSTERFVLFPRDRSPFLYDMVVRSFELAGVKSLASPTAADMPALMGLVATGVGCAVVPASYQQQCPSNIVLKRVSGLEIVCEIELVFRTDNRDPLLLKFVDVARSVARNVVRRDR